jgi:hypothetical protein
MQQSRDTTLSAPGWVADQWKFWRGVISAGAGPAAVPAPLSATGGTVTGGVASSPLSVDSQTYPFSLQSGGTPTLLVARQPNRSSLNIENNGPATLFIFFGAQSQNVLLSTMGISVPSGESYTPPAGVPVDEIYGWTPGVQCNGVVITGT